MHRGKIDAAGNRTHVVVPCHVTSTRAGKGCVGVTFRVRIKL